MEPFGQAGPASSEDSAPLLVQSFQRAWGSASDVDMERFLPQPHDPGRHPVLLALIEADLQARWQRHQPVLLESYLQRFPELGSVEELPAALLVVEYEARHRHGDRPPLVSYQARFPRQFPQLDDLVQESQTHGVPVANQVQAAIRPNPSAAVPESAAAGSLAFAGNYRLLEKLGAGSFAEVWRGEAPGGFPVAIKRVIKPLDHDEAQRELQALQSMKQLRHLFLLQTHLYFLKDNQLYVVMELADGTLRDRQRQCQQQGLPGLPLAELLTCCREAAEALDYMHGQHLLHRDVKPQNILLCNGHVKLADFGLATWQQTQRLVFTANGAGTPAYMAPEVWQGKVSTASDQYSLAFTYTEQRLGHWPFPSKDIASLMYDHLHRDPDLDPLPAGEQAVLRQALAKDPRQRYPTCLAFATALTEAVGAASGTVPLAMPVSETPAPGSTELIAALRSPEFASVYTPTVRLPAQRRGSRRWLLLLPVLGLCVLGATVAAFWLAPTLFDSSRSAEASNRARSPSSVSQRPATTPKPGPLATEPTTAQGSFDRAVSCAKQGDFPKAVALFTQAVKLDPRHALAFNGRGNACVELAKYDEAYADYAEAIRLQPKLAAAYGNRGNLNRALKRFDDALADFKVAVMLEPTPNLYNNRGTVHLDRRDFVPALADFNQALDLNPKFAAAYNNRGNLHFGQGQHAAAIADYSSALRIDPRFADALRNRGTVYNDMSQHGLAAADFDRLVQLQPKNREAYYLRARSLHQNNELDKAIADYVTCIQFNPGDRRNAEPHYYRGNAYLALGQTERALADFSEAIRLEPTSSAPYINRAILYTERKELDRALADANKAIELSAEEPQGWLARGVVHAKKGDYTKAIADYTRAIELKPAYLNAYHNRAIAYEKSGDDVRAKADREMIRQLTEKK